MMNAALAITGDKARLHAKEVVNQSDTSFGLGMKILSGERREAMYAIYAFCREVDDIADEPASLVEKKAGLQSWREEIERIYQGVPSKPTGVALLNHVRQFNLPKEEFILMIEGMEMDAEGPVVAPPMEKFLAYTRRVAGTVGMLSMPVFGVDQNEVAAKFALSLGDALQITNILRDVKEDALEHRLYLPSELLTKYGCPLSPDGILKADGLPAVCEELAVLAREKFTDTREALKHLDWKQLRPALLMMGVYEAYLEKMSAQGWANGLPRVSLSKFEKTLIAARWFVAPKIRLRSV